MSSLPRPGRQRKGKGCFIRRGGFTGSRSTTCSRGGSGLIEHSSFTAWPVLRSLAITLLWLQQQLYIFSFTYPVTRRFSGTACPMSRTGQNSGPVFLFFMSIWGISERGLSRHIHRVGRDEFTISLLIFDFCAFGGYSVASGVASSMSHPHESCLKPHHVKSSRVCNMFVLLSMPSNDMLARLAIASSNGRTVLREEPISNQARSSSRGLRKFWR
jgi:hypothetical protein